MSFYKIIAHLLIILGVFTFNSTFSQALYPNCPSDRLYQDAIKNSPEVKQAHEALEKITQEFGNKANSSVRRIIPVVVHIIHEGGPENIPDANVIDFIRVLNEDFQKRNADTTLVATAFQGIIGDLDLEFRLASKDPNGNCTNGITRIYDPAFTNNGFLNYRPISWPRSMYLNVWVVNNIPGAGAFSNYPASVVNFPVADGVVCRYTQFGSLPPSGGNFSTRTMTHEIGHWLNLPHTWGSTNNPGLPSNCQSDDGVADTPLTIGVANQGCNLNDSSCGTLNNVNNYMDYSTCGRMFTVGQVNRMEAALTSSVSDRNNLFTVANLLATGTDDASFNNPVTCPPIAEFAASPLNTCEGNTVSFTSYSYNSVIDPSTWNYTWTFENGTPATSNMRNPVVTFSGIGSHDVTLQVSNIDGSSPSYVKADFINTTAASGNFIAPYTESISNLDFPNNSSDSTLEWRVEGPSQLYQFQRDERAYISAPSSVSLNNFDFNNVGEHYLVTPMMNLTNLSPGSAFLNFWMAHSRKAFESELLKIQVNTTCNDDWITIRNLVPPAINTVATSNSAAFVPNNISEWDFFSTNISPYAGQNNIRFRFNFSSKNGNNLFIDDIAVTNVDTSSITSIQNDFVQGISIYPNPNKGRINLISNNQAIDMSKIQLYDVFGKEISISIEDVSNTSKSQFIIQVQDVKRSKGIYFLSIKNDNGNTIEKIIIE